MERRTRTIINQITDGTRQAVATIGKPSAFKVPTFDGTGPWELYRKQFEAAVAHNQWTEMEKAVILTAHLEGAAQRLPVALSQSDNIEYATLVNCLEQRFG